MKDHKIKGKKNTENYKILFTSKDKKEAVYHEALFQAALAIDGLPININTKYI